MTTLLFMVTSASLGRIIPWLFNAIAKIKDHRLLDPVFLFPASSTSAYRCFDEAESARFVSDEVHHHTTGGSLYVSRTTRTPSALSLPFAPFRFR